MASTRNRNTLGNYKLEQKENKGTQNYCLYKNSPYGESYNTGLPGYGLLPGNLPRDKLSNNPVETESFLFGIGSTHMVTGPAPCFVPEINSLDQVNIYEPKKLIMPYPVVIDRNRPFPCPP